ncbi:hypothetical protein [Plastoroseomonas arctica]|uniref:Uncharacterized protein n=1 Tax=Plastoroseomonas arctica TaxID=1509237 RepID=A0AAF1JYM7_9PROT|nr:hypothetical protein [Plastoroseomonas arctica]MBR0657137.1 hypothetical protein [Plastoroseomonas arctica]
MTRRTSLRNTTAALALLAAGWIAAANPAFADSVGAAAMGNGGQVIPGGVPTSLGTYPAESASAGMWRVPDTEVVPQGRAARSSAPEGLPDGLYTIPNTEVVTQGRAARSTPVEVGIPAAPVKAEAPVRARMVPPQLRGLLREADAAIGQNRLAVARERLEQAETTLLNARTDGEQGFRGPVREIASARAALGLGNRGIAQQELGRAVQSLDRYGS